MNEIKKKNRSRVSLLSVALIGAAVFSAAAVLEPQDALALTALKQVQVSNGSRVDLLFDGKVSRSQIKTEFFRDIIQISLNGVSVYPAKISSVSGGALTKIFAYQYAPKLVRCRLSVSGKAEDYKNRVVVTSGGPGGTMLTIRINDVASGRERASVGSDAAGASPIIHDAAERALLSQVMRTKDTRAAARGDSATSPDTTDTITEKSAAPARPMGDSAAPVSGIVNTENRPLNLDAAHERRGERLGASSELPNPVSALGKLALVIGLFGLIALAVKKIWKPGEKIANDNPLLGALGRFARKNLGANLGSKRVAVEVLSNHHLGPKKSIAVIRVSGRTMVVGITEQSINLISQLSSEEDTLNALAEMENPPLEDSTGPVTSAAQAEPVARAASKTGAASAGPEVFSKLLQSETAKPALGTPVANTQHAATAVRRDVRVTSYGNSSAGNADGVSTRAAIGLSGVRAQIRSKLEGFKQI